MSEPIRVLQVFVHMNRGGAETMIMNVYRNIDRKKVQFDFIVHTMEPCSFDDEIRNLGGQIFCIPKYTGTNHFKYICNWKKFFEEHSEYMLIHGHVRSTAAIYLRIAKKFGLTTIAHSHSTKSRGNVIEQLVKAILQRNIRYIADRLLACSQDAGNWLFGSHAISTNKFDIAKNAINTDEFKYDETVRIEIRQQLKLQEKFVLGHVGNFTYAKNHEFLIEVFEMVHKKNINSVLILVGNGELEDNIINKVKKMGLIDSVIFLGSRSDVPELLQGMDCFVFPSLFEGLGISLIEAQATGLRCVVSNNLPEEAFVTNLIEKLSLKQKPEEWSEAILKSEKNNFRKDMRVEIEKSGYDIKANANWLENFYLAL